MIMPRYPPAYDRETGFDSLYNTPCSGFLISDGPATVFEPQKCCFLRRPYLESSARSFHYKKQGFLKHG